MNSFPPSILELLQEASEALQASLNRYILRSNLKLDDAQRRADICFAKLMESKAPKVRSALVKELRNKVSDEAKAFPDNTQQISGSEIDIIPWKVKDASAALVLHWADNEGVMQHLMGHGRFNKELCLPPGVMPTYTEDIRRIYFVREGIDIRDSEGQSLGRSDPPTVPLGHILLQLEDPIKSKLLELWSRETGLTVEESMFGADAGLEQKTTTLTSPHYPASAFIPSPGRANRSMNVGARGHQISEKTESKKFKDSLPLQPGDAHWLFYKFLEEVYPGEGLIDTGSPEIFGIAGSMWIKLGRFLGQPKYRHHPMLQEFKAIVELGKNNENTAGVDTANKIAIQTIRPGATKKRERVSVKGMGQKWKVIFEVPNDVPESVIPLGSEPALEYYEVSEEVSDDDEDENDDDDDDDDEDGQPTNRRSKKHAREVSDEDDEDVQPVKRRSKAG